MIYHYLFIFTLAIAFAFSYRVFHSSYGFGTCYPSNSFAYGYISTGLISYILIWTQIKSNKLLQYMNCKYIVIYIIY